MTRIAMLFLCLAVVAAPRASAQTEVPIAPDAQAAQMPGTPRMARVTSGEHEDFTRIVIEMPDATEWQLGRTATGYEFAVSGPDQPRFDLTGVWDRIPRTRLRSVWADPATGYLVLGVGCACHAFPFEFRPGTVVIDFKDGSAPPGSAFEAALDGEVMPPLQPPASISALRSRLRPQMWPDALQHARVPPPEGGKTYAWLPSGAPAKGAGAAGFPDLPMPLRTGGTSLEPIRDALLQEFSRGASSGVIDMRLPASPNSGKSPTPDRLPWSRIVIGELPGVAAGAERDGSAGMQSDGAACIPDARLAIADWGDNQPASRQIAETRAGLVGEFDVPDPSAITQAVRRHLYLGFGAEALQYLDLLEPSSRDEEARLYAGLARIIDGMEDPSSPFAPMLECDSAAALWSALLFARLPTGATVNVPAILRSFAALPPHLRQHLGPSLAERFLFRGDHDAARMVRDATARSPHVADRDVDRMDAQLRLSDGQLEAAESHARKAMSAGDAHGPDAALTLVEASFHQSKPVGQDLLTAIASYLTEAEGTKAEPALRRAEVLALGLAGRPAEAFAALKLSPETAANLWQVIAARATDDQILNFGILGGATARPQVSAETARRLATRLLAVGFSDAALKWLGNVSTRDDPALRQLAAKAELSRGNAVAARILLDGLEDADSRSLVAEAMTVLGEIGPATDAWQAAGDSDQAHRLSIWQQDWPDVAETEDEIWAEAARLAMDSDATGGTDPEASAVEAGLLEQGNTLVTDSGATRKLLRSLLEKVPNPSTIP